MDVAIGMSEQRQHTCPLAMIDDHRKASRLGTKLWRRYDRQICESRERVPDNSDILHLFQFVSTPPHSEGVTCRYLGRGPKAKERGGGYRGEKKVSWDEIYRQKVTWLLFPDSNEEA